MAPHVLQEVARATAQCPQHSRFAAAWEAAQTASRHCGSSANGIKIVLTSCLRSI